jgi:hypothetical protein
MNLSKFLAINKASEYMYCDVRGNILRILKKSLQVTTGHNL